jgi:hypothetical protein
MVTAVVVILCLPVLLFLLLAAASLYFFNVAIVRRPKEFLANNEDLATDQAGELATFDISWPEQHPFLASTSTRLAIPRHRVRLFELEREQARDAITAHRDAVDSLR